MGGPGTFANPNSCILPSQFAAVNASGGVNQPGFGNVPRSSFRGLGFFGTDLNINKAFKLTERVSFELGGSMFNILNHPNFALPVADPFVGPFGQMASLAVQPTTPYGSFQGAGVEGRLIQVHGKITF